MPLFKASPWISMCAVWAAHKGNGNVGVYVEGRAHGVGAERLAVLRRGAGLKLLPLSDLRASLVFIFINPKLSPRDKPQRTIT